MPKRKVTFEEPEGGGEGLRPPPKRGGLYGAGSVGQGGPGSRFSGKPSLDSDEEEEEEEEEEEQEGLELLLGEPGGEEEEEPEEAGPEGAGPEGAGPVPFTPFNLWEELQEGHFDPQGHFLPRRDLRPPDPWLESIEGVPIKPRPPRRDVTADVIADVTTPPSPPPLPHLLGGILGLLQPGETVGGAMRRMGGASKGKGRGRGKGRGQAAWPRPPPAPPQLEELVELADGLVARGVFGVFQETRERLEGRLRALGHAPSSSDHAPSRPDSSPSSPGHAHPEFSASPSPGEDWAPRSPAPPGPDHALPGCSPAPSDPDPAPPSGPAPSRGHAPLDMFAEEEPEGEGGE